MLCQIIAPQKQVAHLASLSFAIVFATSAFPSVSLRKIWQFYVTDQQLRCDYALYAHTSQGLVNVCFPNNGSKSHSELEEFWNPSWFFFLLGTFSFFLYALKVKRKKKYNPKQTRWITKTNKSKTYKTITKTNIFSQTVRIWTNFRIATIIVFYYSSKWINYNFTFVIFNP